MWQLPPMRRTCSRRRACCALLRRTMTPPIGHYALWAGEGMVHCAHPCWVVCSLSGAGSQHSALAHAEGHSLPHASQGCISCTRASRMVRCPTRHRRCSIVLRRFRMGSRVRIHRIRTSPCQSQSAPTLSLVLSRKSPSPSSMRSSSSAPHMTISRSRVNL